MIEAGAVAPDFTLPDQDGDEVSLQDLAGQISVLVFYPLDFSPVCTDQLNVYQELLSDFEDRGVKLIGISVDSAYAHKAFQERLNLSIPLLADFNPKGEVARSFGVYREAAGISARALVMIDEEGIVRWAHRAAGPLEIPGANLIFDALAGSPH